MRCQQCGKDTPANLPNCIHCGYSFKTLTGDKPTRKASAGKGHTSAGQKNAYAKPGAPKKNPYANPHAAQNPYKRPEQAASRGGGNYPPQRPAPVVPNPAPAGAGGASSGKLGLILGTSIGGGVLLIGIIIAMVFAFGSGKNNTNQSDSFFTSEDYSYLDEVYEGFQETEKPYLKDGYADPSKADELLQAEYDYAQSLVASGKATDATLEKETFCVTCTLSQGDDLVYTPDFEEYDSGGEESRVVTYQPYYNFGRHLEVPDEIAEEMVDTLNYTFKDDFDDSAVNFDTLKKMKGAKAVFWHGHGGSSKKHKYILWTTLDYKAVKADSAYTSWCESGGIVLSEKGRAGITYQYLDAYFKKGDLDGAVIYLGTCFSGYDENVPKLLLKKGAAAVYANDYSIHTVYNVAMMESVGFALADGYSVGKALKIAQGDHGKQDPNPHHDDWPDYHANVKLYGNDSDFKLKAAKAEKKKEKKKAANGNYNTIDNYIIKYAATYVGGYMPFRGDGSGNIYFGDSGQNPAGIYAFNTKSAKVNQIVKLDKPKYGTVQYIELYESGCGVKAYNTGNMEYEKTTVYSHSGKKTAGNANAYICEYDGKRVYSYTEDDVESWRADGGKVYNSDFDFSASTSGYRGASVRNVITASGKEFIMLHKGESFLITAQGSGYAEVVPQFTQYYVDGSNFYYLHGGNIMKVDLSAKDYKPAVYCAADADFIYYVSGNHVCYGKSKNNGAYVMAYAMDKGSKPQLLVEDSCPMDGI